MTTRKPRKPRTSRKQKDSAQLDLLQSEVVPVTTEITPVKPQIELAKGVMCKVLNWRDDYKDGFVILRDDYIGFVVAELRTHTRYASLEYSTLGFPFSVPKDWCKDSEKDIPQLSPARWYKDLGDFVDSLGATYIKLYGIADGMAERERMRRLHGLSARE